MRVGQPWEMEGEKKILRKKNDEEWRFGRGGYEWQVEKEKRQEREKKEKIIYIYIIYYYSKSALLELVINSFKHF